MIAFLNLKMNIFVEQIENIPELFYIENVVIGCFYLGSECYMRFQKGYKLKK